MAFKLSNDDNESLDSFFNRVFDLYDDSRVTRENVIGLIGHFVAAASIDNFDHIRTDWINDNEALDRWFQQTQDASR